MNYFIGLCIGGPHDGQTEARPDRTFAVQTLDRVPFAFAATIPHVETITYCFYKLKLDVGHAFCNAFWFLEPVYEDTVALDLITKQYNTNAKLAKLAATAGLWKDQP